MAAARSVLAGDLGLTLDLDACPGGAGLGDDVALFSESNGRFLVTIAPERAPELESLFDGLAFRQVGKVIADPHLEISRGEISVLEVGIEELRASFQGGLDRG